MDFKEKVLKQLEDNGANNFGNELKPFMQNLITAKKRRDQDWIRRCENNIKWVENRQLQLKSVLRELNYLLQWNSDIQGVEKYLSEYGTFCDRYTMYYNKNLETRPIEEAAQIILCEYLNSIQDYFIGYLTEKSIKETRSTSFICFYHLGQVEVAKFAWYSQITRHQVWDNFMKKYPQYKDKYITFEVNKNAAEYLFDKMIFDDPKEKLGKINKLETSEILEVEYFPCSFMITSNSWTQYYRDFYKTSSIYHQDFKPSRAYYEKGLGDNNYKRVSALKKVVKENKEYINIAKKLSV